MRVRPVLGEWEIPNIASIGALERRPYVEHEIPGRPGSLYQDMDAAPVRVAIAGSLHGDEARGEFVEEVRGKFRAGEPLTFVADIVTATSVQYVVIEVLRFSERGTSPDELDYLIVVRESPPPPPPPDLLGGLDAGLVDQAGSFLDTAAGALAAVDALTVPDFANPTPPLSGALDGVRTALGGLEAVTGPLSDLFGTGP